MLSEVGGFRRDLMRAVEVLGESKRVASGQNIRRTLEEHYGSIGNSRLYPALDGLGEDGFVEAEEVNGRTNRYVLTGVGREQLDSHRSFMESNQ